MKPEKEPKNEADAVKKPQSENGATRTSGAVRSSAATEGQGQVNPAFEPDDTPDEPLAVAIMGLDTGGDHNQKRSIVSRVTRSGSDGDLKKERELESVDETRRSRSVKFSTISEAGYPPGPTKTESLISSLTRSSFLQPVRSFHSYGRPNQAVKPLQKPRKEKCGDVFRQYLGILITLVTSLIMSLGSFFVKLLQEQGEYSPFLTTFWRFLGVLVPAIPTLLYFQYRTKKSVMDSIYPCTRKGRWKAVLLVVTRGIVGTSGFIFQYFALNYITLADTSVISFSSPIFVLILGKLFLKEDCGFFNTFIAFGTVLGVIIIAKPPFVFGGEEMDKQTLTGIGLAAASCFANTLVYICLRFLKDVHFSVISVIFGIVGLIVSTVALLVSDKGFVWPKSLEHWFLFVGVAVLGFLGQVGLTFSLKYEQAGIVSAFRTSDVIFSFIWQGIDGTSPTLYSVLGAFIVILCVGLLAFRKWLQGKEPDHKLRRRCCCVLR